ncbi:GAF domain-containing sensor histidine kinase [Arthrobacter sp. NamB2]|uniref:GAF domain-containing sensor histidine kinase n=1 Tax=Arthrobacter sp. NamB2 TaxID=2576035 RepID=UPI0010C9B73F|nr:GAF domain-containing sensor histidine kinase [Arthrobacter sp. NamB2]TKV29091.1 GAF domain-containing sensor histidine kinase [Arthrobacter sp. NamB2]
MTDQASVRRVGRGSDHAELLSQYGLGVALGEVAPAGSTPQPAAAADAPAALQNLVALAVQLCNAKYGAINVITEDEFHQIAALGLEPLMCARDDSLCGQVFQYGHTVVVPDCREDPRFRSNPFVDGRFGEVRFYATTPLLTRDGVPLGTLCIFDEVPGDLTEQQVTGLETLAAQVVDVLDLQLRTRQLDATVSELRRSNELLGEFAGRISHDLQGPLTNVVGLAELAEDEPALQEGPAGTYFKRIGASALRMASMVENLLGYSRVGGAAHPRVVPLAEVVGAAVDDLGHSVDGVRITADDFEGKADREQLRVLIQNLLTNAVAYARPGVPPEVRITGTGTPESWRLDVADNGKGIPPEDYDRVLEPLVRLEREGDPAGTGIGLATCVRIAQAHGGRLTFDQTPGGGLTVRVWFGSRPS